MRISKEVAVWLVRNDVMLQMNIFVKQDEIATYLKKLMIQDKVYTLNNGDLVYFRNKHWQIIPSPQLKT